ncbi:hypothetical protein [Cylindrospermopsis curvispora]|uniref:Uncharacterized protein n=1 Tax=Cylindrospermopsis curvispora GIHE-G1 TaxID=2666332 RepID=A0A7H0EYN6_9CYAN|nr:hypothetical protein [Cylindrospermopsis curvispora]QNP28902.1 hypothetical protein IAR63_13690 [Cylindrospermopsis curvispora GIHE-G1]
MNVGMGDRAALPAGARITIHTGDCEAHPTGDCAALPLGDREGLATWRLSVGETGNQFPVSKRKSVENRLVLSVGLRDPNNPTGYTAIFM